MKGTKVTVADPCYPCPLDLGSRLSWSGTEKVALKLKCVWPVAAGQWPRGACRRHSTLNRGLTEVASSARWRGNFLAGVNSSALPPGRGAQQGTPCFSWQDRKPLEKSFLGPAPAGSDLLGGLGTSSGESKRLNGSSVIPTYK